MARREAVFSPMPGSLVSSRISREMGWACSMGIFGSHHSRDAHAPGEFFHLLGDHLLGLLQGGVHRGHDEVLDLVEDGVNGLWDREGDVAELRRIVTGAMSGTSVVSPDVGAGLLSRIARASEAARGTAGRLTSREREILVLMADGVGNRAIADALFISENTVRNHVRNVLDKLQARTRTEAVVRAVRAGLIRLS